MTVAYEVTARTVTWMPIRMEEVAEGIASQAVAELGRGDLLRLVRLERPRTTGQPAPIQGDLLLHIEGDIVEDAGNFTVTLSIRPLKDPSLPSFVTAGTVSISGRPREAMYQQILAASQGAAKRLMAALRPRLSSGTAPSASQTTLPEELFEWGKLVVPKVVIGSDKDMATFANSRLSWDDRKEAGFRLSALAFDRAEVRHLLERVALTDPDPLLRQYALRFLEPSSRVHPFTQRVILAAAREESDPRVKGVAVDLSEHCVGLSPTETLQTWVQLLTSPAAELDNQSIGQIIKRLQFRLNTPNLDLGLLACLRRQEAMREGRDRKSLCLDLARDLPPGRRSRILQGYLDQPLHELTSDMPGQSGNSPLVEAVQMSLGDPCQGPRLRKVLHRLLEETTQVELAIKLLKTLADDQLTPGVFQTAARLYQSETDENRRWELLQVLRSGVNHRPPWGVLAWPAARKAIREIIEAGPSERHRSDLDYADKKLAQAEQQKHRVGLRPFLRPDSPPLPGAVGYFARCVREESDPEAQRDCLAGFRWLLEEVPQLRDQAMAAAQTLVKELPEATQQRLDSIIKSAQHRATRKREPREEVGPCPAR